MSIRSKLLIPKNQIILIVLLGLFLRLWAAWMLPVDADEPVYVGAAAEYARMLKSGDLEGIIEYRGNSEHPPLIKLLYGGVLALLGDDLAEDWGLFGSRLISVLFGTLAVWIAALIHPLAGMLLAVQTTVVKYTSQAYLEALPLAFSLLAVYCMLRTIDGRDRWFWLSAIALGLTASGKFSYFPVLVVILFLVFLVKKINLFIIPVYFAMVLAVFWIFNPALWVDPVGRLMEALRFHTAYAQGAHVAKVGYPWYQPIIWIWRSNPYNWHPDVFFYYGFDGIFFWAAIFGIKKAWREQRWAVVWLITGMVFLLLWPTKWPQYTLVVLPAICLIAAPALVTAFIWLREQDRYYGWVKVMLPSPSKSAVLIAVGALALIFVGAVINFTLNAIGRQGWSNYEENNSPLPSNAVHDLLPLPDGRMLLATERGLVVWQEANGNSLLSDWQVIDTSNSDLPSNQVRALALTADGALWIGTSQGLARTDQLAFLVEEQASQLDFQIFQAADLNLGSAQINDLAPGADGRIWVATLGGLTTWDGRDWQSYPEAGVGGSLPRPVFSVALRCPSAQEPCQEDQEVWLGLMAGISRFVPSTQSWTNFGAEKLQIGWGGFSHLMVDSQNRLWAGNLGGGIDIWDGEKWSYLLVSNSDLPYNTIQAVYEAVPGEFWIATSIPNSSGGLLARLSGSEWTIFQPVRTGYSGAEVMAISEDHTGRLWFATITQGVDVFKPRR